MKVGCISILLWEDNNEKDTDDLFDDNDVNYIFVCCGF